jgi:hypothetical protein
MVSTYNAKDISFDFQSLEDVGEPWDNVITSKFGLQRTELMYVPTQVFDFSPIEDGSLTMGSSSVDEVPVTMEDPSPLTLPMDAPVDIGIIAQQPHNLELD